jgi:alpha-methylacyl-CoA racemase
MGPLADLRVVELGGIGPVPFTCMMLADFGAQVIRIDRPEPLGAPLDPLMRGRDRFAVDLRRPAAVDAVLDLVERADVVIEGFRPGVTERMGLGPDVCLARNTALVYARMSGWGQDGPFATEPGHDINYIGLAGYLDSVGTKDSGPVLPLNVLADYAGGGSMLAFGILAAVHEAKRSGVGQTLDASLLDGAAYLMTKMQGFVSQGRWIEHRQSNFLDGGAPYYHVYETADGRHLAVGALEQQFFDALVRIIDVHDFAERTDPTNWPAITALFEAAFAKKTQAQWLADFEGVDACVSAVLTFSEAREHPQAIARNSYVEVGDLIQPAPTPRFSRTPAAVGDAPMAPGGGRRSTLDAWGLPGEHADEIMNGAAG